MAKKHTVSETNETISAVITALGEGAVGIIPVSYTHLLLPTLTLIIL